MRAFQQPALNFLIFLCLSGFLAPVSLAWTGGPYAASISFKKSSTVFPPAEKKDKPTVRKALSWFIKRYLKPEQETLKVEYPYDDDKTYHYKVSEQSGLVVSVEFSHKMVPAGLVDKPQSSGPISFTPAWRGTYKWTSQTKVQFIPATPWKHKEVRRGVISTTVKSLRGYTLSEPFKWKLNLRHSYYVGEKLLRWLPKKGKPQMVTVFPQRYSEGTLKNNTPICLLFDQPVKASMVRRLVSVSTDAGKLRYTLKPFKGKELWGAFVSADHVLLLSIRKKLAPGTKLKLVFDKSLIAHGQTESDYEWETLWQTEFEVPRPLTLSKAECHKEHDCKIQKSKRGDYSIENFRGYLNLSFSNSLKSKKPAELLKLIKITPKPAKLGMRISGDNLYIRFDPDPEKRYRVSVGRKLLDADLYPLAKAVRLTLKPADRPSVATLPSGNYLVEPGATSKLPVKMVNLKQLSLAVYPLSADKLARVAAQLRTKKTPDVSTLGAPQVLTFKSRLKKNRWQTEQLDLAALSKKGGQNAMLIALHNAEPQFTLSKKTRFASHSLVQLTNIGMSTKLLPKGALIWVTRLSDGKPIAGATIQVYGGEGKKRLINGTTGADGTAILPYKGFDPARNLVLVAQHNKQLAYTIFRHKKALRPWYFKLMDPPKSQDDNAETKMTRPDTVGMVVTDRGIYRPGEVLLFKAFFRKHNSGLLQLPASSGVKIVIANAKDEDQQSFTLNTNGFGSVAGRWKIKSGAGTGRFRIKAYFDGSTKPTVIKKVLVTEFRKPAFQVAVGAKSKSFERGKKLKAHVEGRYFFGAPMRGVRLKWSLHKRPARFRPPGHRGYSFALAWRKRGRDEFVTSGTGKLGNDGFFRLAQKLVAGNSTGPFWFTLESEIQDIDRQTVSNRKSFLVHPGEVYIGVKLGQPFAYVNKPIKLEAIAVTPTGKLLKNRAMEIKVARRVFYWFWEWDEDDDYYYSSDPKDKVVHNCKPHKRGKKARCTLKLKHPGLYVVKVKHKDRLGNTVWASKEFNVTGRGDTGLAKHPFVRMELMLDKTKVKPGENARVLVKNPFKTASVLLTVERYGVLYRKLLPMKRGLKWVSIPIKAHYAPNVYISAYLVSGRSTWKRDGAGRDLGASQYRVGYANLKVSRQANRLNVQVKTDRKRYDPGQTLQIDLKVTNSDGKGVKSEVALMVVDESVLSLTNHKTPNPSNTMYPNSVLQLWTDDSRWGRMQKLISLVNKGYQGGGGDDDEKPEGPTPKIKIRKNFVNTLLWKPQLVTDDAGNLRATVKLPDNLTTFRVMAVVMDNQRSFGSGEAKVLVNKPFLMRAALPRFMKVGDLIKAGVVIHNKTKRPMTVTVRANAKGLEFIGTKKRIAILKADVSSEVTFQFKAPKVGLAQLTFTGVAKSGDATYTDGLKRGFPVQPLLMWENAQVQGTTIDSKTISLKYPPGVLPDEGEMEVEVSASMMGGMRDGLDYLVKYPYGCVEQTTSSTYPLLSLMELLPSLGVSRHKKAKLVAFARKGIDRLVSMQTRDGGLGYWPGNKKSHPYGTAYAMLAINEAVRLKVPMPPGFQNRVANYLVKQLAALKAHPDIKAHMVYVLAVAGKPQPAYANRLFETRHALTIFGKSFLALALKRGGGSQQMVQTLTFELKKAFNSDGSLVTPDGARSYSYWSSTLRKKAVALTALLQLAPASPLNITLAQSIIDNRKNGYWYTTQRTTYALMSLTAFARKMEQSAEKLKFVVGLGEQNIDQNHFTKVGSLYRLKLPIAQVLKHNDGQLTIRRIGGPKRLFYTLRTRFVRKPSGKGSTALSKGGLLLFKRIETLGGRDLTGKTIPAGQLVRIRLFVYTPKAMNYVALNDPLPAGLEAVNTALSTSSKGKIGDLLDVNSWHPRRWYLERTLKKVSHQEFRDNRVVFFSDKLPWRGLWEFGYLARATTRGRFTLPPARIEAMYDPQYFSRSELISTVVQ